MPRFTLKMAPRTRAPSKPVYTYSLAQQKSFFLDRQQWRGILDSGEQDALKFAGGYIRTVAKNSMRKTSRRAIKQGASGYSAPGEPPRVWEGTLKKMIYFHLDPETAGDQNSVVVGPAYLPEIARNQGVTALQQQTIPRTLEKGGWETKQDPDIHEYLGPNRTNYQITQPPPRTFYIAARPYMNPALRRSAKPIMRYFRNMLVKGGVGFRRVA